MLWLLAGLVVATAIATGIGRVFLFRPNAASWPPEPCVVKGVDARCGTFVVPENRAKPNGRTIGLHVVVLPAFSKPAEGSRSRISPAGRGTPPPRRRLDRSWQSTR